jgi:ATP:ADP antiporter, AAA family
MATPDANHRSPLDRFLGIFADVHSGEGLTALLLALNVFLILMAYYILKPVREALILGQGSAALKTYMSAGQVVVLAFVVPLYAKLVASRPRMRLINTVTAFFTGCLIVFYFLAQAGVPLAIPYFIWIGVFSLMIVAQFWSFANVIYDKSEGERLFAIVGFGASLGAVVGARMADKLIEPLGINLLFLLGAAVLGTQVLLTNYVDRRERAHMLARKKTVSASKIETAKHSKAFALVFKTRYLVFMAVMLMLANWVNTTGEYILGDIVKQHAANLIAAGQNGGLTEGQIIGDFYSQYFTYVNVLSLVLQLFVVSRIVKYLGVKWAIMILPCVSLGAYNVLAFIPTLNYVLTAKVAENATDYSLNNTVRNMLFLPCTYEEKFSAKQAIDSFFVRMGDVLSAALVFFGTNIMQLAPRQFAAVNAVLVLVWLVLAWNVGRIYAQRTAALPKAA